MIGTGVEFAGQGIDDFGQVWNFSVDVFDAAVTFSWTESTKSGDLGNISGPSGAFSFDLNLAVSTVPTLVLTSFTSTIPLYNGSNDQITSTGPNSVHFGFYGLHSSDTYTFTTPVPEPATYAMLLAGLGLIGAIARRRDSGKTVEAES